MQHWIDDPLLQDVDSVGERVMPIMESPEFAFIGAWEDERAQLINVVRHLVFEVRDLFERLTEHDDDHRHDRA